MPGEFVIVEYLWLFNDIVTLVVRNLGIELVGLVARVVANASRFQDNHRSSLRRLAFSHVVLSGVSRLFAAPVDIHRSFNHRVSDISRKACTQWYLLNNSLASDICYFAAHHMFIKRNQVNRYEITRGHSTSLNHRCLLISSAPCLIFPNLFVLSAINNFLIRSFAMGSMCFGHSILPLRIFS